jgi:hypothetical protein
MEMPNHLKQGNGVMQSGGDNDAEPSDAVRAISPEFWPEEELEYYKKLNTGNYEEAFHSVAHGPGAAMIVENSNALGAHIGTKVLEANGTAADTAIAAAVANIVLNFGAPVSFAGYMNAVYFDATKKEAKVLHGHFRTIPENDPRDLLSPSYPLGALTPIPAFFADVEILLETYGSGLFTLSDLLAPSIWLAEQGLYSAAIVDTRDSEALTRTAFGQKLSATLAREPDYIPQPAVAALLRNISKYGIEYFYKGDWAEEAVEILREWGSNITMDHLADYMDNNRPNWQDPQVDHLSNEAVMYALGAKNNCTEALHSITQVTEAFNIMSELGLMQEGASDFTNDGEMLSYFLLVTRYTHYMEALTGYIGMMSPLMIATAYTGPAAPVEEGVHFFDPIASANYRSSREHAQRVAEAIQTPAGIERMNSVIDLFTFPFTLLGGTHSDGMVIHDKQGNVVSLVHTMNSVTSFGTGLFVQGVALPDALITPPHPAFLQGPFNDRSKSVLLPAGLQINIVTGDDGLPKTITSAIGMLFLATPPLVLLTNGWGRGDLEELVNGPHVWPAPGGPLVGFDLFRFFLFTTDEPAKCDGFCRMSLPFPSDVVSNLEPWILPYVELHSAEDLMSLQDLAESIGPLGMTGNMPTLMRVQNRSAEGMATEVEGAIPFWPLNGIADPVRTHQ